MRTFFERAGVASFVLAGVLGGSSSVALASSDAAWAELFNKASIACQAASGLKDTSTPSRPVDFDERVLVMVDGTWPQAHMNNKKAVFACLYGKTDGKAEAQEMLTE
jgi:hypothetical protein